MTPISDPTPGAATASASRIGPLIRWGAWERLALAMLITGALWLAILWALA